MRDRHFRLYAIFKILTLHPNKNFKTMEEQKKLNINLPPEIAEGVYSNLAFITHSQGEFILDFVRVLPGMTNASVKSRIVLTPEHAKRFADALLENIEKYEHDHGKVSVSKQSIPMGFTSNPKGDA